MIIKSSKEYSIYDIEKIVYGEKVSIDQSVVNSLENVRRIYENEARKREIYGYCTGLGALQGSKVGCGSEIEETTIMEHAVGAGPYVPKSWIRAFLAVRIIQLSRGHAPIKPDTLTYLVEVLNKDIYPLVPLHGSIGASGDLAPSSFIFRCTFLGKGMAMLNNKVVSCKKALDFLNLNPPKLSTGESLFLINNTSWTSATLALALLEAERLVERSLEVTGSILEIIGFNPEHFSEHLSKTKLHETQVLVAKFMSRFKPRSRPQRLQDPYSFRCIPQIYGAVMEAISFSKSLVEREINSSSENPVVNKGVYHGCNFHTSYLALASEVLAWALTFVTNSIYQRVHNLMDHKINRTSDFLTTNKSTVGAMILEYLVASLTSEARSLSNPRTIEWLPTSLNQEDANPMTPNSILRVFKLIDILAWEISAEATLGSLIAKRLGESFKWAVEVETTELDKALKLAREKVVGDILRFQPLNSFGLF